jgi:phosphoribosylanthranilate isomerase
VPELKVCGVTDAAFAAEAARRGVDYLGFVFAEGSLRRVGVERAREIVARVRGPRFVGVFSGAGVDEMISIARDVRLDVVQLHGDYDDCDAAAVKAAGFDVWRLFRKECAACDAVLLDGADGDRRGGTGHQADWALVAALKRAGRRVVLAGGLSAENVAAAVATGADVLDVNSSLEIRPGVKSADRLDAFLRGFERACRAKPSPSAEDDAGESRRDAPQRHREGD